jgi:hypothetical protein
MVGDTEDDGISGYNVDLSDLPSKTDTESCGVLKLHAVKVAW